MNPDSIIKLVTSIMLIYTCIVFIRTKAYQAESRRYSIVFTTAFILIVLLIGAHLILPLLPHITALNWSVPQIKSVLLAYNLVINTLQYIVFGIGCYFAYQKYKAKKR